MHRKLKVANRESGFTLTEAVVASALLIVAMVPILKGLTTAHLNTVIIERRTRSLTLAQAKLDEIKARSIYGYGSTFTEDDTPLDGAYLCDVTDDADPNLRTITVSVGYDINGNSALSAGEVEVNLVTYLAKRR